jgi:hypothetical protein
MTCMTERKERIGLVTFATILAIGNSGDALAKVHHNRHWHAHARRVAHQSPAQLVPQQPARLGPMRYYGGPKSPMWRGPTSMLVFMEQAFAATRAALPDHGETPVTPIPKTSIGASSSAPRKAPVSPG